MLLPHSIINLVLSYLSWTTEEDITPVPPTLSFQLRHLHAVSPSANVLFHDVPQVTSFQEPYLAKSRLIRTARPSSMEAFQVARRRSREEGVSEDLQWVYDEILGPDVESRETLLTLANMTSNAYTSPDKKDWHPLDANWTTNYPFGWEPDEDGFRGYVFATPDNSTVVLSIKGTSVPIVGGGPTTKKDKINDNLLFSCCCARVDWSWSTVCGCYRGGRKCDQNCVESALVDDSLFYPVGINLYNNLTYMYPHSNIWVIGHSLGGSLGALMGTTFGVPVVAFEAPGERMAARRLHLPSPPSTQHITHVYNTADSIAMGSCTGVLSACATAGYALESKCHLGQTIVYDTVSNLSWSVGVTSHVISTVIENVLSKPWPPAEEVGREVPVPASQDDCVDCFDWEYGDFPLESKLGSTTQSRCR
ncbi:alpha/beta-hydrolase [Amylostereum chailletii]|nr:alpha/beta-hydrolase [Amylostereum chailletii]